MATQTHDRPTVLVFDVNETLLDIESLRPHFERIFGDAGVLREWFAQLVLYSMTVTLADRYLDFFSLGRAVLRMTAAIHGRRISDDDLDELSAGMQTLPAHPDVAEGLCALGEKGYRLVTLTNSPPNREGITPLENAGIAGHFERQFSVDTLRAFKPSPRVYTRVATELGVHPSECMMVAAHVWDTLGAQTTGYTAALITRPGNAVLAAPGLPEPDLVVDDLRELAVRL